MTSTAERRYGGETAEERLVRRRASLIDAAISVIDTQGWRQLNVERICESAGLIRRYFYESFPDIDAIAAAVVDELADEILGLVVADDLTIPPAELISTMIETLVDYTTESPGRARVFFGEMAALDSASERRVLAIGRIVAIVARDARAMRPADGRALDVAASLLVNGSMRTLLDWLDGTLSMSREEFVGHLSSIWLIVIEGVIEHTIASRGEQP